MFARRQILFRRPERSYKALFMKFVDDARLEKIAWLHVTRAEIGLGLLPSKTCTPASIRDPCFSMA